MDGAYVSFPQRPADDALPAMSKLYYNVHKRLASIVTNATNVTVDKTEVVDTPSKPSYQSDESQSTHPNQSEDKDPKLKEEQYKRDSHSSREHKNDDLEPNEFHHKNASTTKLSRPIFYAARKADPSVHSEPLTVLGDVDYLDAEFQSPTKDKDDTVISSDVQNNSVPGFALQREISSESEAPPSPLSKRRPSISREDSISTVLTRLKSGRLSKEFWMKDQNAHVCFRCEAVFNTFRRKHHCRLCGQIFCANCTILTSGGRMRQRERIRACKTCNRIMDEYADITSDSEVESVTALPIVNEELMSTPTSTGRHADQFSMPELMKPLKTPLMAIPAARTPLSHPANRVQEMISLEITPSEHSSAPVSVKQEPRHESGLTAPRGPNSLMNWSQGLLSDLAAPANPFRKVSNQSERLGHPERKVWANSSSSTIDYTQVQPREKSPSEEEEDYWGANSRTAEPTRARADRASRMPQWTSASEDTSHRKPRRRGAARHNRTKSKSLIRQNSTRVNDSPSLLPGNDFGARGRTRSRSNSIVTSGTEHLDTIGKIYLNALLRQMLADARIDSAGAWQNCLYAILMKVALDIQPKVKEGASGYINNYVKIKRIAGAKPTNCEFLSGAVFTHKLAHKQMPRFIRSPRIMLIAFPLEYHRADASQLLSLEPVMAQEKEYLKNLVKRILALRPSLLLVQNSVSGLALEYLLESNVAVAYLVKESAMAIVSGLTGADIITSVDRLAFEPRIGKCDSFEVKTYANHTIAQPFKKTYFFFRGCPPELGCSIVLRGGDSPLLEKIKRIVELMVFVVYNLKLETSLLRDQFAVQTSARKDFTSSSETWIYNCSNETLLILSMQEILGVFEQRILSASPSVHFPPPYLIKKAVDIETRLLKHKAYEDYLQTDELLDNPPDPVFFLSEKQQKDVSDLTLEQQENIKRLMEAAELRKLNQELQHCKSQWKTFLDREIKEHRRIAYPQDRQAISVLFSAVCSETGTPCTMPTTELIQFYKDSANDVPLGQYIEDSVYSAQRPCPTMLCGRKNMDHHRSYVHAQARVSVIAENYSCPLPGMQNSILMWNYCKKCDSATPLMTMSENTWSYSFGKYLELTFYAKDIQVRSDKCPHNLCCDHVRYFGFRDMAIRFDYDPVAIMGLALPQPYLDWQPGTFVRLKNEEYKSIQFKITAFYDSLEFRLYNMNSETLVIEQAEAYRADLTQMRGKAKDERTYLLNLLQEIFENSAPLEYLCLNRALRVTQDKVTSWNETFDEMERLYLPSEKDIRRLTTAHLRKLFSLDDSSRLSIVDDESLHDNEGKRSVSAPVVQVDTEKTADMTVSTSLDQDSSEAEKLVPVETCGPERVVSMPLEQLGVDSEPRGFHPRRTYDTLIKAKAGHAEETDHKIPDDRAAEIEAPRLPDDASELARVPPSAIPKPALSTRHPPEEGSASRHVSHHARTGSSRSPSVDQKTASASSIPIFKGINDPLHLRKKSITNSHLLSKQIQDIGESIVGSVEKRWNEQKRFSAQNKDQPQRNKAGDTKVTSLAKHFEQLTREFEKERIRARRMLNSRGRPTFAVATQKPTVAVFDNVSDAVDGLSDEEEPNLEPLLGSDTENPHLSNPVTSETTPNRTPIQMPSSPMAVATKEIPEQLLDQQSNKQNDAQEMARVAETTAAEKKSDIESSVTGLVPASERNTLMKTLSNFWADRSSSNWTPLEYPLPPSEHMFLESDVVVREDEPSSLIAFTLSAQEYMREITNLREAAKRRPTNVDSPSPLTLSAEDRRIRATLQNPTGIHMRFGWGGDKSSARLTSRIFYAEQFDALRRFCGCDENYVTSLSRCVKWDSSGGKSGAAFLKTQDDRLIVKQLSKIETEQFLRFAPNYFEYMADNFFNKLPVSLCKILGFYQITSKNPVTGRFMKMDVIVMENLFYKRKTTRIFDLKGSMRNRKVQQTGRENEVLLDENFVELVSENPLFVRDHARRFLKSALHNDTLFLAQNNVMDYSLIIGIDDERHELIVGIIDFIRTYTWDKKLESWVKERGLVGGGSAKPTVVTPKMYKTRFREAMDRYIFGIK